ncbi:hypothetical protein ITI46_11375 [Streptomyces oryzae]|uniref:DUF3592 domain-containing protein n=1 Tax=Streptomyces oryzae TaxID=1434886 RepID=A0ABS3XB19_9ACTN|nr:hypothetical protein [Streptomyces oryzae]MBO8192262.1 hypothetical protein [Streptomyces oryzae]
MGAPLLVVGMAYGGATYAVDGGPGVSVFFGNALVVVAFLLAFATGFLYQPGHPLQPFVAIVTSVLLAAGVLGISNKVEDETLRARGESTDCRVLDVDRQVHTSTYTDSNGVTHTTTTVDYKHKLRCAGGRPDSMTLEKKYADKGERVEVTFDPRGRVDPEPTRLLERDSPWHTTAWVAPLVAIGLRLLVLLAAVVRRR